MDAALDAELVHDNHKAPSRLVVHRDTLAPEEVMTVDGVPVTNPARTAFGIGRRTRSRLTSVQRLDALENATGFRVDDVEGVIAAHPGSRDLERLRRILPIVDGGSESPQETRTRLDLIDAGFPTPETQIVVRDRFGGFVARLDMGYRDLGVGIEYDGLVALTEQGWVIIRVSAELLHRRRGTLIARVEAAMCAAGWSRPCASGKPATLSPRVAS